MFLWKDPRMMLLLISPHQPLLNNSITLFNMLQADYLVVGAGAASMAFVDTILTEQPNASVVIVDGHSAPGGHWNDAYGFVRLHQPSLLYGVPSSQMEGNWAKLLLMKGTLPWNHRATKDEILAYYQRLMNRWVASGRVSYYPNCIYDFDKTNGDVHSFHSLDDKETTYNVKVAVKLVNGILGECQVPSKMPPTFPVDDSVTMMTPNQVYDKVNAGNNSWFSTRTETTDKYVVLGAGKTAMDTVVYLQRHGVKADDISWVIPNDVWSLCRTGAGGPWSWGEALLNNDLNVDAAALELEKKGIFTRLDPHVLPTKFRFPVIGKEEMKLLRNVKNIIRRGRVTSIAKNGRVSFTDGEPLDLDNRIFVHCTSPGPFNGNTNMSVFPNDSEIRLCMLYAPPVPISMSSIAVIESRRRNGTYLDLDFGRKMLHTLNGNDNKNYSDNDVLNQLITGNHVTTKNDVTTGDLAKQVEPLKVLAYWFAIFDQDPVAAQKWLVENRLSFFSIPGFKGKVYETVLRIMEKKETLGLSKEETEMLSMVGNKLKPLEGM